MTATASDAARRSKRVLLLGASGTIGRAAAGALVRRGHEVVCLVRPAGGPNRDLTPQGAARLFPGAMVRTGEVTDRESLSRHACRGERFDVLVSCLASRSGVPSDAWAIDHRAHLNALDAAQAAGIDHMVLLSAICVQKPRLAFQHAKLAFEQTLIESGIGYSIVRPTAFFKSLSGQVERVKRGKPFVMFGDGTLTACKPIADEDLAEYLADCIDDEGRRNRVLPIGGPGKAITPREQGEFLFQRLGRRPRFRCVPVALLQSVAAVLAAGARVAPALAAKAELARIGCYYATESMLVFDRQTGRYDAAATPSTGQRTLFDHYDGLVRGGALPERGDHRFF